jgi:tetratricopeptide (TPR) repeat protein
MCGADYSVGDLVVAVEDVTLKVRRNNRIEVTDSVFPGVTMRVRSVSGRWLWVSNGVPGWIKNTDVIPLDKAIDYFTAKIDAYPTEARWRYARAVAWTNKGELDIAIADYTELIKLRRLPAFYHVRGICYHAKGDYAPAISDFNEALRLNPRSARYYNSRSESWHETGEYARAIADCDEAIRLEPNLASAYTNRGRAYEKQGDVALAVEDYKKSMRMDPNYDLAYTHHAWLMATSDEQSLRDGELAVKYAEKACKLTNWEDPHALGVLAAACAEAGRFDDAVKWEQKAQSLYTPEVKAKWAFLLDLYKKGKPYRQGMAVSAS